MDSVKLEKDLRQVIHYITVDLNDMDNLNKACFPTLMAVSSGIDFFGGLQIGFNRTNADRYAEFTTKYMSQANPDYNDRQLANYLYLFLRCKIVHEGCISGDIITRNADDFIPLHMKQKDYSGKICMHMHPKEFKKEFMKALDLFMNDFDSNSTFKNNILSNFNVRITDTNSEISRHPFDIVTLRYGNSETNMDSTGVPYRNIVISGEENINPKEGE